MMLNNYNIQSENYQNSFAKNTRPKQVWGFSTLEIIIAIALITLGISAAVLVSGSGETLLTDAENGDDALVFAEEGLLAAKQILASDFSSAVNVSRSSGIFSEIVQGKDLDSFSKKVTARVSWDNGHGGESRTTLSEIFSDLDHAEAGDTCGALSGDWTAPRVASSLSLSNLTDVDVFNKLAFVTADSAVLKDPDFYVIDISNPANPVKIAELNTGPGLQAIYVSGSYAYVANTSSNNQLQVIDLHDPRNPTLLVSYKVPGVDTSSSGGLGRSIFYERKRVYLGVTKNNGPEFNVVDVSSPSAPVLLGSFETNTLVNTTRLLGLLAFVATPNTKQIRVLNVSNPNSITEVSSLDLPDSVFQDGKSIVYSGGTIYLGRTVGADKEFHTINFAEDNSITLIGSRELGGSANDLVLRSQLVFVVTNSSSKELQILDVSDPKNIFLHGFLDLPDRALNLDCEENLLYTIVDGAGFFVVGPK